MPELLTRDDFWARRSFANMRNPVVFASLLRLNPVEHRKAALDAAGAEYGVEFADAVSKLLEENNVEIVAPASPIDTRPNPAVLGFLTARLYAVADERGVQQEYVETAVMWLYATHGAFRESLDRCIEDVLQTALALALTRE